MPRVMIVFTSGVEEIELIAVVDILRRANIDVTMASLDGKTVTGRSGITIQADMALEDTVGTSWDMLVLPGGLPNTQLLQDNPLLKSITTAQAQKGRYLAAICAAPAALASFGLLENKCATSHPSVQNKIQQSKNTTYLTETIVEDDNIITSRGAGTAIEFALYLAEKLSSKETAKSIRASILA